MLQTLPDCWSLSCRVDCLEMWLCLDLERTSALGEKILETTAMIDLKCPSIKRDRGFFWLLLIREVLCTCECWRRSQSFLTQKDLSTGSLHLASRNKHLAILFLKTDVKISSALKINLFFQISMSYLIVCRWRQSNKFPFHTLRNNRFCVVMYSTKCADANRFIMPLLSSTLTCGQPPLHFILCLHDRSSLFFQVPQVCVKSSVFLYLNSVWQSNFTWWWWWWWWRWRYREVHKFRVPGHRGY